LEDEEYQNHSTLLPNLHSLWQNYLNFHDTINKKASITVLHCTFLPGLCKNKTKPKKPPQNNKKPTTPNCGSF